MKELKREETKTFENDFWEDRDRAKSINIKIDNIKREIDNFNKILSLKEDVEIMLEIDDEKSYKKLEEALTYLLNILDKEEIKFLMNEEYDKNNCIVHIHSGAGGKDASQWAEMLERVYFKWANKEGIDIEMLDRQDDEGGIKYSTFQLSGLYSFGKMKCERGIHRLVRISPFDSNARRHTSFASISVSPEVDDIKSLEIKDEDIRIDTFRSSGAGGQSVNTTDSAVRITHLPTGITSNCSKERSQIKNREHAMKILKSRILELELKKREKEMNELSGDQKDVSWGNQIRSYVFHPYRLVKDHRTNYETSNLDDIMNGKIDEFIDRYLRYKNEKNKS